MVNSNACRTHNKNIDPLKCGSLVGAISRKSDAKFQVLKRWFQFYLQRNKTNEAPPPNVIMTIIFFDCYLIISEGIRWSNNNYTIINSNSNNNYNTTSTTNNQQPVNWSKIWTMLLVSVRGIHVTELFIQFVNHWKKSCHEKIVWEQWYTQTNTAIVLCLIISLSFYTKLLDLVGTWIFQ